MCSRSALWIRAGCAVLVLAFAGCEKSQDASSEHHAMAEQTPDAAQTDTPITEDTTAAKSGADSSGQTLSLDGIQFPVPEGWEPETVKPGPFAAVAAYTLPNAEGGAEACTVRVTHFPNMKGKDSMNVDRWLAQVKQADGRASTREDAEVVVEEHGSIRLTTVDVSGSLSSGMPGMGGGTTKPGQRMIAAIVDHPKGPHFVKVTGEEACVAQWEDSVQAFLHGAQVQ